MICYRETRVLSKIAPKSMRSLILNMHRDSMNNLSSGRYWCKAHWNFCALYGFSFNLIWFVLVHFSLISLFIYNFKTLTTSVISIKPNSLSLRHDYKCSNIINICWRKLFGNIWPLWTQSRQNRMDLIPLSVCHCKVVTDSIWRGSGFHIHFCA